jgi:hypothetical protein
MDAGDRSSAVTSYLPPDRSNSRLPVPGRHLDLKEPIRLALPVRMSDVDPRALTADVKSPVHAGKPAQAVWEKRATQIKDGWQNSESGEFEDVMLGVKLLESYRPPIPLKQELLDKAAAINQPCYSRFDSSGNFYISECAGNRVRKVVTVSTGIPRYESLLCNLVLTSSLIFL